MFLYRFYQESKTKTYVSTSLVDPVTLPTLSIFVRKGNLGGDFLEVCPYIDWGVLTLDEDKRIWSGYGECVIPFYEWVFSILDIWFPFNSFEIEVFTYLMVTPSQLYHVRRILKLGDKNS